MTTKRCPHCSTFKELDQFYVRNDSGKPTSWCKKCIGGRARERRLAPETREQALAQYRKSALGRRYGLTLDDYDTLLADQLGRCGICRKTFSETLRPNVDHDHNTGEVRGILCGGCNSRLGYIENADRVESELDYLTFGCGGLERLVGELAAAPVHRVPIPDDFPH